MKEIMKLKTIVTILCFLTSAIPAMASFNNLHDSLNDAVILIKSNPELNIDRFLSITEIFLVFLYHEQLITLLQNQDNLRNREINAMQAFLHETSKKTKRNNTGVTAQLADLLGVVDSLDTDHPNWLNTNQCAIFKIERFMIEQTYKIELASILSNFDNQAIEVYERISQRSAKKCTIY